MNAPVQRLAQIPKSTQARYYLLKAVAGRRCDLAKSVHRTHRGVKLNFDRFPFQRDMYRDTAQKIVVVGCTQRGKTEWATITTFAALTLEEALNALYIMPDISSKTRYVQAKFDPTKKHTPYYRGIVRETDSKDVKKIGGGFIAFGISSRISDFKEFSADLVIIDELELCAQDNLKFARDRMTASDMACLILISNPQYKGGPIEREFAGSDQKHWHADCPGCKRSCKVGWFESVVKPAGNWFALRATPPAILCDQCSAPLNPAKGYWVPENPGHPVSGYRLNHVMSSGDLAEMWREFNEANARNDTVALQRIYNSRFGLPFSAPGAGITLEMLAAITERQRPTGSFVAGIDLHGHDQTVVILCDGGPFPHIAAYEKCHSTAEAQALLTRWKVSRIVTDSEPGGYFVREWVAKQKCAGVRVALARHQESLYSAQPRIDDKSGELRYHRTWLLDDVWHHVKSGLVTCEQDLGDEFDSEMTASTRYLDVTTEPQVYRWVKGGEHAMFAVGFALRALNQLGHVGVHDFQSARIEPPQQKGF